MTAPAVLFSSRNLRRVLVSLLTLGLLCGLLEVGFRITRERFGVQRSEIWLLRNYVCYGQSRFQPCAFTGWTFRPGEQEVNAHGFLDEPLVIPKDPETLRIACLGGSTTAGSLYQGIAGSYPDQLETELSRRLGRPVEVLNFGIPGWTSAQSLVNYVLLVQRTSPDLVIVHHAVNDVFPRLWGPFEPDYRHYHQPWKAREYGALWRFATRWSEIFTAWQLRTFDFHLAEHVGVSETRLEEEGDLTLDPETAKPFVENLRTILGHVRGGGGTPIVLTLPWCEAYENSLPLQTALTAGLRAHNDLARGLAAEEGFPLIDLAAARGEFPAELYVDLVHLTPEGNRLKAVWLADRLAEGGYLGD